MCIWMLNRANWEEKGGKSLLIHLKIILIDNIGKLLIFDLTEDILDFLPWFFN